MRIDKRAPSKNELARLREEILKVKELEHECRRAQEALENERSFVSAILDTAGALVVVLDTKGRIVRFNRACEKTTGYTFEEVKGRSLWDMFIPAEEAEPVRAVFEELKSGMFPNEFENYWVAKDGNRRLIAWSNTALSNDHGSVEYVIGTGIDITERRQAEEAMRRLNNELKSQAVKLETINKELEAYSYTVSHDLRNPLLGIQGFCRLLLERHSANLDEKGRQFVGIIHSSTQEMLKLIDDLLTFSISGNREMKSSNIDMNVLASAVFEELRGATSGRALRANFKVLPPVYGDQGMIRQVLLNLISNALKFTRSRPIGIIEIGGYLKENEIIYYVRDNGIGFDTPMADNLFVPFHRLSNSSGFDGTGLGLAIVKRIIDLHGGRVWAEGEIGKGAAFYFSLPQIPAPEGQTGPIVPDIRM